MLGGCRGGRVLCAGTTISVMDTWPLVSSLRSRTAARGGRFGISIASFNSVGSDTCSGARRLEQLYWVAGRILDQDLVRRPAG